MNKLEIIINELQEFAKKYNLRFYCDYGKYLDGDISGVFIDATNNVYGHFTIVVNENIDIYDSIYNVKRCLISNMIKMQNGNGYSNIKHNKLVITNVIFNEPATIVFWSDDTKTIVKAQDEAFDPEKGLSMAITKKTLGNRGDYYYEIKKWVKLYEEGEMGLDEA